MLPWALEFMSFQICAFDFFGYIPRSGLAGSYDNSTFSYLKNLHIVLRSGYTSLHSHQQCTSVPILTHPHPNLLFVEFLMLVWQVWSDVSLRLYMFTSLMISDVEHLFMGPLAICMSSLEKMSIEVFCPFLRAFFFLILSHMSCLCILDINSLSIKLQIFSPISRCFLSDFHCHEKHCKLVPFAYFCLCSFFL